VECILYSLFKNVLSMNGFPADNVSSAVSSKSMTRDKGTFSKAGAYE